MRLPVGKNSPAKDETRPLLARLPRRNLQRALFLLLALLGVLAFKQSGLRFGSLFEAFSPAPSGAPASGPAASPSYHLQVVPAPKQP